MRKSFKHGDYQVRFRDYNNLVVYCDISFMLNEINSWDYKKVTGKAFLHKDDTFNIIEGRKIAFDKAIKKVNHIFTVITNEKEKELKNIYSIRDRAINGISHRYEKFERKEGKRKPPKAKEVV